MADYVYLEVIFINLLVPDGPLGLDRLVLSIVCIDNIIRKSIDFLELTRWKNDNWASVETRNNECAIRLNILFMVQNFSSTTSTGIERSNLLCYTLQWPIFWYPKMTLRCPAPSRNNLFLNQQLVMFEI